MSQMLGGQLTDAGASGDWISWLPSWKYYVISVIRLRQSMHIYLKNIPTKFHFSPIWNDEALGFFEEICPNKKYKNTIKMCSDMGSVPAPKCLKFCSVFGHYRYFKLSWTVVCYSIKRDILPVVLSLCQDVDYEVRACMSRLLDPVARGLGYVSHFLFISHQLHK